MCTGVSCLVMFQRSFVTIANTLELSDWQPDTIQCWQLLLLVGASGLATGVLVMLLCIILEVVLDAGCLRGVNWRPLCVLLVVV